MCGRYTVNTEDEIIEMREIIQEISIRLSKEYMEAYGGREAYPSMRAPVITTERELTLCKWGFKKWNSNGVIFNARSEGIATSRFFASHLKTGRCIVPASSYFEWQRQNNKPVTKYKIFANNEKSLYMAGIIRSNPNSDDEFAIITREAAKNISFIHHRMPLILNKEQIILWLDGNYYERLLYNESVPVDYKEVG